MWDKIKESLIKSGLYIVDKNPNFGLWLADHVPNTKMFKDIAYNIVSNPQVGFQAGATNEDVVNLAFQTPKHEDTNKYMFIYGADTRRPQTNIGNAYDWSKDIKDNEYTNVKAYEGILNPYNEYLVDSRNKGLIEAFAKARYTPTVNLNGEYMDSGMYKDDVHSYRPRFHTKDGKPVISASDLYDFGKEYTNSFKDVYEERTGEYNPERLEVQRRALNSVGQPYLLVQKDIPIRFVDNPRGSEINRVNNFTDQVINNLSDQDIARITKSGYIKPAIISQKNGGSISKLNSGGNFHELLKNLILGGSRTPSIVGGISYNSINNNKPVDIYGEQIDLESLVPYFHSPIHVEESIPGGYQKQYNFENPKEDNVPITPTLVVSDTSTQDITPAVPILVTPTVSIPVVSTKNTSKSKTTTKLTGKEGFKQLVKLYESALEKRGIDKSYAKWLASKDALETGWGLKGHGVEHLNYGNITAGSDWSGKTYEGGDHDAKGNKIKQKFRAYDAIEDYIEDQLNLYNLERYKDVFVGNVSEFADRLYKAGYAEDPEYVKKIKSVYNSW